MASIEAEANVVVLPHLPSEFLRERLGDHHEWTKEVRGDDPESVPAELIVAKNKLGPKGHIDCRFHLKRMRFYDAVPAGQVSMIDELAESEIRS